MLMAQTNFSIEGAGFFQNRTLKARLAFLQSLETDQAVELDAALLEDSAFLLLQQLKRKGYLQPAVEATLTLGDTKRTVTWTSPYSIQLDVEAVADTVSYEVMPGVMAYYDEVVVAGVTAINQEDLQRYFVPGGVLFKTKQSKVFTQENLDRRISRVLRTLDAQGYREAQLLSSKVKSDPQTGATSARLKFSQGPRYYVGEVTLVTQRDGTEQVELVEMPAETVLTPDWEQTQRTNYRNLAFEAGYPDASIIMQVSSAEMLVAAEGDVARKEAKVRIEVTWGELVRFKGARFVGDDATRRSLLRRQLNLEKDEPLNLLTASEARRQLMGLGIYKQVDMAVEPRVGASRELVYRLEPSVRQELKLLAGWGSYEQLRAGFKWEHKNPFGRAHRYEVEAKQSFKSSRAKATYSIPQVFGTEMLLYTNIEYSYREEISYERTNRGVAVGTAYATDDGLRLSAEYGFFKEEADRENISDFQSEESATVGSLRLRLSYDGRNDFLAPTSGWTVFSEYEVANQLLGGSVNFQRLEMGGSYHFAVSESSMIHIGLRGGSIFTGENPETNIPFNRRFFNGGENTVRGYREGEASPLDVGGDEIGAETYALFNIEWEQRVFSKLSTVLFFDSVLNARDGFFNGEEPALNTVGVGLRYQTVVGPVRLEYGHNLNPRESDRSGSVHFSIGFPF
jgi:outer membrane protein assembly factor BamA